MMELHRFNDQGLQRFHDYLDALREDPALPPPVAVLTDPTYALPVDPPAKFTPPQFANRMEAAQFLDGLLSQVTDADVERDVGLWSWLTLLFFDQVCPMDGNGRRRPRERAVYVPQVDVKRRFYRHVLLGPWLAFRAHKDAPHRANVLLADPLNVTTGESYRLFIETPYVNMHAPVEIANDFYFDEAKSRLRRGSGVKGKGGLRRLIAVLHQLDVTFDLHYLPKQELLRLLPAEFDKWRSNAAQLSLVPR